MVRENKSKKKTNPVPFIIGGTILLIIIFAFIYSQGSISAVNAVQRECKDIQVAYEEQEEYFKTEYYTESVPYTSQECDSKVLVYNKGSFNLVSSVCNQKVEECQSYTLGFCTSKLVYCTDRTIRCSLEINNLDDERGTWSATFKFYKSSTNEAGVTDSGSVSLDPRSSGTIYSTGKITSKELFDSQYTCSYLLTDEPTKQVCRDVIKYQDIQRERQVTAYRPITKYKTEQQCT